ncbi:uncharacterized protein LOC133908286 [Phragmites australis]|uniref:uncharacterized protein LOC133908286 n=1 Tax=Phragmites australis TaxID=29695 RepID=UPI002D793BF8|nr:uncharacterized protein LOC133908286 [Phragmites australis]
MDPRQAWKEYLRELCFPSNDSSDEEDDLFMEGMRAWQADLEESERRPWGGGSVPGRKCINRYRHEGHMRLFNDYFADPPVYPDYIFRRRFRMKRDLFMKIVAAVEEKDPWFVQRRNAAGELGLSALQKVTAAFRMLAYDAPADSLDECLRLGESTIIESMRRFVNAVVQVFGDEYLRSPNEEDTARLLAINSRRGFLGMLGSVDCMHWRWKNCPTTWAGSYTGHVNAPTIILEAVASQDLWIWHAFFGMPGSLNDINVLHRSHLLDDLAAGQAPKVNYTINGQDYTMGYYLADGIYPEWATFVKPIPAPVGRKRQHFVVQQAAARKDVERAFGVLQSRFPIVRGVTRLWDEETLSAIMTACIIMHNMIIEDEREDDDVDYAYEGAGEDVQASHDVTPPLMVLSQRYNAIRCKQAHVNLREDLVEHLWQLHGGDV